MKYTVLPLIVTLLLAACNNPATKAPETQPMKPDSTAVAEQVFFPVPDYIGGQLKLIDSLQLPISKTVTINNKSKLSSTTDAELKMLAQTFREPDISSPELKKHYKQTSIADESVPSVTLIFTADDPALEIQKINVFVKPDPVNNDQVTGVYIEKSFSRSDTSFSQRLYWKTGKNMQVNTEKTVAGKLLPPDQVKITWDYTN